MLPFQQQLQSALDTLDAAFASEEPVDIQGCLYCYGEADFAALSGPVHLLSDDLVASVALEVPDHWSDFPGLFRRMTPRVIRAAVAGELHVDEALVATRLVQAGWRDWPVSQVEALSAVWHAWWRATLEEYPGPVPVTDVLTLLTVTADALAPWLAIWAATRTAAADRHLEFLLGHWLFEDEVSHLELGFHGEYHATPELVPWLLGPARSRFGASRQEDLRWLEQHSAHLHPADPELPGDERQ